MRESVGVVFIMVVLFAAALSLTWGISYVVDNNLSINTHQADMLAEWTHDDLEIKEMAIKAKRNNGWISFYEYNQIKKVAKQRQYDNRIDKFYQSLETTSPAEKN